ncbi:hypothetical protein [Mesobacterium pallidum]|uniref:hypothetical protein n=1 Tax=Mesobacterium pallidum TaxID=2872037 RepID=UPI001EE33DFF|nr:hypothetical protein [Mesobacterium pallidum]
MDLRVPLSPVRDVTRATAAHLDTHAQSVPQRAAPEHPADRLAALQDQQSARRPVPVHAVPHGLGKPLPHWLPNLVACMSGKILLLERDTD